MFTPEGYWSWSELLQANAEWTLEILAVSLAPELTVDQLEQSPHRCRLALQQKLLASGKAADLKESQFSIDLIELWLLANFMDTYEAVLCSPEGRTLRCPPLIKSHGDAFEWWVWPLSKKKISDDEASSYFAALQKGVFNIGHAQARFCAIDFETGTICLKPNTVRLIWGSAYGHTASEQETIRFIEQQIRPIVGWSICWNPDEIPDSKIELYNSLGFVDLDWEGLGDTQPKQQARKDKGKHVLDCVTSAFPQGKGNATWATVESKVGYSRRSITRALKQSGRYVAWAGAGQRQ